MSVCLVDVKAQRGTVNKDLAGGFGTRSSFGTSLSLKIAAVLKKGMINIPVMSLGYLSSMLKEAGIDLHFSEGRVPDDADACIVYTSLVEHEAEIAFAGTARRAGCRVGFVGPMATALPDLFLEHGDFVIKGEPEAAAGKYSPEAWRGVVDAGLVADLDALPFPDWSIFDSKRFSYKIYLKKGPIFPVLTSRGCPHPCGYYCPYPFMQGGRIRSRTPENVILEIQSLLRDYGAKGILFRDPHFTFDRERTARIAELLISARYEIPWVCETHPAHLDLELLRLMHRAGLRGLNLGIESADSAVLKACRRGDYSRDKISELVRLCRRLGIRTGAFYTIGQMDDTRESIEDTIKFAQFLNADYAQFTIATPYPGTAFYDEVKPLLTTDNWQEFDAYTPVFRHPFLTKQELLHLKEKAMFSYYFRPAWLLRYFGIKGY